MYNVNSVFNSLKDAGYQLYILDSYPDYPGKSSPCHIVKFIAIKDKSYDIDQISKLANGIGFKFDAQKQRVNTRDVLSDLNKKVSVKE